ncbi:hypothetical protein [Parabacteroides bouchesdurhonensis]|uniref:hypothetical protein n=1 Tax=Parabacteroides bouchesdurhonensis TaxID=1936995 RepID=UPI000C8339A6|nr:hypothetical protein [Parabacteroides bouchesdurhonensis]RHJ91067.1 hypothetical protein DW095_10940 [Bacteroides sp. AM07-16]
MLTTLLFTIIILVICVVLLSVKVLFKKGGRFPNTHIDGNRALGKKGIHCAKTQDREDAKQKNLYDRLKETEK